MKGRVLGGAALVLADGDSVATALEDLEAGREIHNGNHAMTLTDDVPFGHKFALEPLSAGETVQKYGEVIGRATEAVAAGEWVHTHNCESTRGRGDVAATEAER
ncbi:UxaA family hydrolase [Haloferax prahovense]|uniref:UxaA family hydrolase n=1 Tax=Haloferax TaxID=2251 RepID=UPI000737B147|nr:MULTISPECIES: UxaA family hydrolase [unclassified Haloferax]MCO8267327.1 UxaA family hydrolase [Haloferax sp. AB510]